MNSPYIRIVILGIGLCMAGCAAESYSSSDSAKAPAARISKRSQWKITGNLVNPEYAIDGQAHTAAVGKGIVNGSAIIIDLGMVCTFNMVIVDHGPNRDGYCRRVVLMTSVDGKEYEYRWAAAGRRSATALCTISPILARYVRIEARFAGTEPWSVGEVHLQ